MADGDSSGRPWPPPAPPPRRPRWRPRWLPPLVLALSAALVGGAVAGVSRPATPVTSAAVATFVPADGEAAFSRSRTPASTPGEGAILTTESAIISGQAITGALDYTLATQLIGAAGADEAELTRGRYWRTVTRPTGPADQEANAATTRVRRLDGDIALMVESGPGVAFSYRPNLVELPADAAPGRQWTGQGQIGTTEITYRSSFAATNAAGGCLQVDGTISYSVNGQDLDRELSRTWCPGRGIVAETDRLGGGETRREPAEDPPLPAADASEAAASWTPTTWTAHRYTSRSRDLTFGEGAISGTPASVPPVRTRSGAVLRTVTSGQDIVAFSADTGDTWRSRWRAHPGGTVLTLAAFGDVVVATTSARTVVGYDADGVRRWRVSLDEVVMARPSRISPTAMVLVTLGGEVVSVDLHTGRMGWRIRPGVDIGVPPAVGEGVVVVADRAGRVFALDPADGAVRWTAEADGPAALGIGHGQVVVAGESDVDGLEVASGERIWRTGLSGTASGLTTFGPWMVLITAEGTRALRTNGREAWERRDVHAVSTDDRYLVTWGRRSAEVQTDTGERVHTFEIPEQTVSNSPFVLATADGVYRLDSSWDFRGWTSD